MCNLTVISNLPGGGGGGGGGFGRGGGSGGGPGGFGMLAIDRRSFADRRSRPVSPSYRGEDGSCGFIGARPQHRAKDAAGVVAN
jgi:hypothetical protein